MAAAFYSIVHNTADNDLEVRLALPKGTYATVVMRELMKGEAATVEEVDSLEEDA